MDTRLEVIDEAEASGACETVLGFCAVASKMVERTLGFMGFGRNCCIAASGVFCAVGRSFGLVCEPISVKTVYANAEYMAWCEAHGRLPRRGEGHLVPSSAWAVGVDTRPSKFATDSWPGHLAVLVNGRILVDPSVSQFSRPELGLDLDDDAAVFDLSKDLANDPDRTGFSFGRNDGVAANYQLRWDDRSWERCPDALYHVVGMSFDAPRAVASILQEKGVKPFGAPQFNRPAINLAEVVI